MNRNRNAVVEQSVIKCMCGDEEWVGWEGDFVFFVNVYQFVYVFLSVLVFKVRCGI